MQFMGFFNFKAPYISKDNIQAVADDFRDRYWAQDTLPVDVHKIVEFDLGMDILTIANFREKIDVDALLLGDLKTIVVDRDMYLDDRMLNRMRYSLAHEIAHKVLHSELFAEARYMNIEEWIASYRSIPEEQYSWIEQHAYEFAGRLLVPPDVLKQNFDNQMAIGKAKIEGFKDWDISGETVLEYLAHAISTTASFGVSEQVLKRRIKIEGLLDV